MLKLSLDKANELLQTLKLGAQVVADEKEADTEVDLDGITADYYTGLKTTMPADIKQAIIDEQHGKALGSYRSSIGRKFGFTNKELEGKTLEEMLTMAHGAFTNKKTEDEQAQQARLDEIRQDYESQLADRDKQIETLETEWGGKLTAAQQKYVDRDIDAYYLNLVDKYPSTGGDKATQAKALRKLAEANGIQHQYDEATKTVKLQKDNKTVKEAEAITPIMESLIPKATDTRHIRPSDLVQNPPPPPNNGGNNRDNIMPIHPLLQPAEQ